MLNQRVQMGQGPGTHPSTQGSAGETGISAVQPESCLSTDVDTFQNHLEQAGVSAFHK